MSNDGIDRRTFYLTAIYGLWALMGTVLALSAGIYLLWPPPLKKADEWTEVGRLSQLQPEVPEELIFRRPRGDCFRPAVSSLGLCLSLGAAEPAVLVSLPRLDVFPSRRSSQWSITSSSGSVQSDD